MHVWEVVDVMYLCFIWHDSSLCATLTSVISFEDFFTCLLDVQRWQDGGLLITESIQKLPSAAAIFKLHFDTRRRSTPRLCLLWVFTESMLAPPTTQGCIVVNGFHEHLASACFIVLEEALAVLFTCI